MESDDKMLQAYNEVNQLMKQNVGSTVFTVDYTKLDGITAEELKNAISRVLHNRFRKLAAVVNGNDQFVVH